MESGRPTGSGSSAACALYDVAREAIVNMNSHSHRMAAARRGLRNAPAFSAARLFWNFYRPGEPRKCTKPCA
jgi:hypothetical protein